MTSTGNSNELYSAYRAKKAFTKWDIVAIALILIIVAVCLIFILGGDDGAYADIYYNGELILSVPLDEDAEFTLYDVAGEPTFSVIDNAIAIIDVDCPNQICVHTDYISQDNERIVCLPNKITVVIRADSDDSFVVTGGVSYA
ncbi:MAG: NusG domain II-containing protein [Bacillota bacterium]